MVNYAAKFLDQLNTFDTGITQSHNAPKKAWQPIQYTSMFWWLAMNSILLLLLLALPILIVWGIVR